MKICINCDEEYEDSIDICPTCDCPYQPVKYDEILAKLSETIRNIDAAHEGRKGTRTAVNAGYLGAFRHSKNLFEYVVFTDMDHYCDSDMKIETSHDKYHITNIPLSIIECLINVIQSHDNNSINFQVLKDTMQHLPELKPRAKPKLRYYPHKETKQHPSYLEQ